MTNTSPQPRDSSSSFPSLLADPRVDRTVALVACLPAAYLIYWRFRQGTLDIVRINLILQSLLFIATMVARRPPVRVTLNPWFWLLAFVATYWIPFTALAAPAGTPIARRWVTLALSWLGLLIAIYARLSLGRNIGLRSCPEADCHDGGVRSRSAPDLHRRVCQLCCSPARSILARYCYPRGIGGTLVRGQESGRRALSADRS